MCVVYRHAPSFLSSMTMPTGEQANPLQRLKKAHGDLLGRRAFGSTG